MPKTFTYDPNRITDYGIHRMRFELGDTFVETGEETCVLCDEEYRAMIDQWAEKPNGWKKAKVECLKAILMKLSYEVDYQVDKMSVELSQRAEHFKELLHQLERSMQIPAFSGLQRNDLADGSHYFYLGMQENQRAK